MIKWNEYPRTKPRESGEYLITYTYEDEQEARGVTSEYYLNGNRSRATKGGFLYEDQMRQDPHVRRVIIAWAFLPEPYMGEN